MNVPDKIPFGLLMHGSGDKGMYVYRYADKIDLGIVITVLRKRRDQPETITYTNCYLPEQTFTTLADLRSALEGITDEAVAAEKAKYPQLVSETELDPNRSYKNRCRLCPYDGEPVPGVVRVHLAMSWSGEHDWMVDLCQNHRHLATIPAALDMALKQEVADRRARSEAELGKLRQAILNDEG